jgi:transcriptional regulator with XRE-family HTH domain
MTNVVPLRRGRRSFTSAEAVIERVREKIFDCRLTYQVLADRAGVANSTVANLANGKTRWPRPNTLFPLMVALKIHIELVDD